MTNEPLHRLAREAGLIADGDWWFSEDDGADCDVSTAALSRFMALVRADERQRVAKLCRQIGHEGRQWPDGDEGPKANVRAVRSIMGDVGEVFAAAVLGLE